MKLIQQNLTSLLRRIIKIFKVSLLIVFLSFSYASLSYAQSGGDPDEPEQTDCNDDPTQDKCGPSPAEIAQAQAEAAAVEALFNQVFDFYQAVLAHLNATVRVFRKRKLFR